MFGHSSSHSKGSTSSSSAIDLTGTPAGLASSRPPSPSPTLDPSDTRASFTRRRTSWVRVEGDRDPLRFDLAGPETGSGQSQGETSNTNWSPSEDPFYSPIDEDPLFVDESYMSSRARYPNASGVYPTAQPGPSSVSLISSNHRNFSEKSDTVIDDDDDAHLTSNMSHQVGSAGWHATDVDPERSSGSARRKSDKYNSSPSPLKRTGTTLKVMSNNLRRASLRVVNLAGFGLEDHIRLADVDDEHEFDTKEDEEEEDGKEDEILPDLTKSLPLRGRTLGYFSSTSRVRVAMYNCLVYRLVRELPFL